MVTIMMRNFRAIVSLASVAAPKRKLKKNLLFQVNDIEIFGYVI